MPRFISVKKVDNINVVTFSFNEIGLVDREELKENLNKLLNEGETQFVLDLSKIGFFSSLVIATIVFFAKEVRQNKGDVKLINLSSQAFSIFQLTQLDKVFKLYESEQEAIEAFKKTE